jgi:hypothetical protein
MQEQAAAIGLHDLSRSPGNPQKHLIEMKIQSDQPAEFEQGLKLTQALSFGFSSGFVHTSTQ